MSNKIKFLVFSLVILALIIPRPTSAVLGTGIFDYFTAVFEGVEEPVAPIAAKMVNFFFIYAIGLITLATSSGMLDIVLANPQWLNIRENGFVNAGYNFTSGLANMLIILIFIVIAFAFILKIETFQAKKALPRLIIVALLLNFSLVFIGMVVDVSNILYGAISEQLLTTNPATGETTSVLILVFEKLVGGSSSVLANLTAWLGSLALSFSIPFVGPFAQLGLVLALGGVFLPNILTWTFQIVSMFLISGILFLLAFFFMMRIFVLQILAILSPLAFLCLVLPQTRKYWQEWLNHFLEWIVVGLFVLFFLVLGLRAIGELIPGVEGAPVPYPVIGWAKINQYFIYYLFLFIYLLIVAWMAKRATPAIAGVLMASIPLWSKRVWAKGVRPMGRAVRKETERNLVELKKREEEAERARRRLTRGERIGIGAAKLMRWTYRGVTGTTPEVRVAKTIEAERAEIEKRFGKDIKSALEVHPIRRLTSPYTREAMGLYLAKMKGGEGWEGLSKEQQRDLVRLIAKTIPHRLVDVIKHRPELIEDEEVGEIVKNTLVPKGFEDEDVKKLLDIGVSQAEAIKKAAFKKAADELKSEDIDTLTEKTLQNEEFQEAIVRFKPISIIRRIGEEKGAEYVAMLRDKAKELKAEKIAKTNAPLLRSTVTNFGFKAIFPALEGAEDLEKIRKLEEDAKADIERRRREREAPPEEGFVGGRGPRGEGEGEGEGYTGGRGPTG